MAIYIPDMFLPDNLQVIFIHVLLYSTDGLGEAWDATEWSEVYYENFTERI